MSGFMELAAGRFSARSFTDQPVEQDKIDKLLEVAQLAPTAHNNQPQRIKVMTDPAEFELVDEVTPCRFGAPLVFLIAYDKNEVWVRPFDGHNSGEVDASIVTTHLTLAAHDLGLGSVWVMYFDAQKASELLSLPDHIVPVALLPVGYKTEGCKPSNNHTDRKPITDLLF